MSKAISTQLVVNIFEIPNYRTKLYGSRRILDTPRKHTVDFDLYFHVSELESLGTSLFELKRMELLQKSSGYISSKPKYGDVFLLLDIPTIWRENRADVLLFTDKRDVAIMDKVLNTLEHSNAHQLLQDKSLRISVYNYMLQLEGFTAQNKANICMDIATKQVHDLIVKSYCKNPVKQHIALTPPLATICNEEKTEISNINNKEQSWLKNTYTKLRSIFTRK